MSAQTGDGQSSTRSAGLFMNSLALDLNERGQLCSISPPLARLLGYPPSEAAALSGLDLLDPATTLFEPSELELFTEAFYALQYTYATSASSDAHGGGSNDNDSSGPPSRASPHQHRPSGRDTPPGHNPNPNPNSNPNLDPNANAHPNASPNPNPNP